MKSGQYHLSFQLPVRNSTILEAAQRMAEMIQVSIIIGYPIVGMLASILVPDSGLPAIFYRALVVICAVFVLFTALIKRVPGKIPIILYLFLLLYALRLLYDWTFEQIETADTSLLYFGCLVLFPVAAVNLFSYSITNDTRFAKAIVAYGLVFLLLSVFAYFSGLAFNPWADQGVELERFQVYRVNPISIGVASGFIILASIYLLMEQKCSSYYRLFLLFTASIAFYSILLSNSRGPILGCSLSVMWFLYSRGRKAVLIVPIIVSLLAIFYVSTELVDGVINRFLIDYRDDGAIGQRLISQQAAIESFMNFPILGQHFLDPKLGAGLYPHNIIIETGMALGLVGLILLSVIILRAAVYVFRCFGQVHPLYTMIFVQAGVMTMTSGTIWSSDAFFFAVGTILVVTPNVEACHRRQIIHKVRERESAIIHSGAN
jgi:hypothetical protein